MSTSISFEFQRNSLRPWRGAVNVIVAFALVLACGSTRASESCPLVQERPMLITRLYFGADEADGRIVSQQAWEDFLRNEVTPRFPNGFTVYEAFGQWMDPRTHKIARERSRVVEIGATSSSSLAERLGAVESAYRKRFRQESVGMATTEACAAF